MGQQIDKPMPARFRAFKDSLGEDVSFSNLAYAYRAARMLSGEDQAAFTAALPELTRQFHVEDGSGPTYFCENIAGGCALTWTVGRKKGWKKGRKYRLHTATGLATVKTAPILALLVQCERMCVDANEFLREPERGNQARQVFSVATYLLGMLDELGGGAQLSADDVAVALNLQQEELARIQNDFVIFAQREAQMKYFKGMVAGLSVIVLIAIGVRLALTRTDALSVTGASVVGVFSAGALGALVSVMQRMTSDKLTLRFRARSGYLMLLGGFRPLIGAVMATALFVFIRAGTLDVFKTPGDDAKRFYFFLAIGFLAGFSERWAQDMLAIPLQSGQLGSASTEQPTSAGPSSTTTTPVVLPAGGLGSNGSGDGAPAPVQPPFVVGAGGPQASATGGGGQGNDGADLPEPGAPELEDQPEPEDAQTVRATVTAEAADEEEPQADADTAIERGASDDSPHV